MNNLQLSTKVLTALDEAGAELESYEDFREAAVGIEAAFATMRDRAFEVEHIDPWRFGLIFCWITEPVEEDDERMTRFEQFQKRGFWEDRTFADWASEMAGRKFSTVATWMSATRKFLLAPAGRKVIEAAGGEEVFMETVSMDKAIRAPVELTEAETEALIDPSISSRKFIHILNGESPEDEPEDRWVREGDRAWVSEDASSIRLHYRPEPDRLKTYLIASFPPHRREDAIVSALQDAARQAVRRAVKEMNR